MTKSGRIDGSGDGSGRAAGPASTSGPGATGSRQLPGPYDHFDPATDIITLVRTRAAQAGDAPAVVLAGDDSPVGDVTLSHRELDRRARAIAVWLAARLNPQDRVLLLHQQGVDFAPAFLGCLYAGMVAVPAPPPGSYQQQRRRLTAITKDSAARIALTDAATLLDADNWAAESDGPRIVATDTIDTDPETWREPQITPDTVAMLQYTSGSTGDPKGVILTHRNLVENVASQNRLLGQRADTRYGGWIPMYHDMGLIGHLLPALFLGTVCVLLSPTAFLKHPYRWLKLIDDYGVTMSAAPDFAYERCVKLVTDEQLARLDLSRWLIAGNGSEPVRASTLREFGGRFAAAGLRPDTLSPCYGMAEATLVVSGKAQRPPVWRWFDADALEQRELRPAPESPDARELAGNGVTDTIEARIVDPTTRAVLPPGRIGEIWLRGGSVAAGYWGNPRATEEAFRANTADGEGGFLRTGDLGALFEGELYVTGRLKDVLVIRGRNLYPHDIEHEIRLHHPELAAHVGAAFTVAAPDEHLVVLHELRGRFAPDRLLELSRSVKAVVAREFGVPVGGVALLRPGTVLRTTSGKIRRSAMRELFLTGELPAVYEHFDDRVTAVRAVEPEVTAARPAEPRADERTPA